MGKSESKERQLFIGVIMQLLNRREIKVKKDQCTVLFYLCPRAMSLFSRREQFSWVPLPSCPPPPCSFQWDLLLCQHMCLLQQFIYKSSVSGPGRGPPSCNKLSFPSQGDFPYSGIKLSFSALAGDSLPLSHLGSLVSNNTVWLKKKVF